MKIFGNLRELINQRERTRQLKAVYTHDLMPVAVTSLELYPSKIFLMEKGIYAYLVQFMVSDREAEAVLGMITTYFPVEKFEQAKEMRVTNEGGESIHFSVRSEFNGAVFEVITNSVELLKALDASSIKPPPPWVAFPDMAPRIMGSFQGNLDYWWTYYWLPYWDHLTGQEQVEYLKTVKATSDWIECIKFHCSKG